MRFVTEQCETADVFAQSVADCYLRCLCPQRGLGQCKCVLACVPLLLCRFSYKYQHLPWNKRHFTAASSVLRHCNISFWKQFLFFYQKRCVPT